MTREEVIAWVNEVNTQAEANGLPLILLEAELERYGYNV